MHGRTRQGLGVVASLLAILLVVCSTQASASRASGPPTPAAATNAFGLWLRHRYGPIAGYWTCPARQTFGRAIGCMAEVRAGRTRHLTEASATLANGTVVFRHVQDSSWVRRWSRYSRRYVEVNVRGTASVNSPAFDWTFLSGYAAASWQEKKTVRAHAYDGFAAGWGRFFDFRCAVRGAMVVCANAFGDAMRYLPPASRAA